MNDPATPSPRGRGARLNPPNRFETTHHELELEQVEEDDEYLDTLSRPATEYLPDLSKSIIAEVPRQPGRRPRGEPESLSRMLSMTVSIVMPGRRMRYLGFSARA